MINFNLDKEDLISLLKGTVPNYSIMNNPLIDNNGYFNGSYGTWNWYSKIENLDEETIFKMYMLCKESWKGE
jgi:hypothetical protein